MFAAFNFNSGITPIHSSSQEEKNQKSAKCLTGQYNIK